MDAIVVVHMVGNDLVLQCFHDLPQIPAVGMGVSDVDEHRVGQLPAFRNELLLVHEHIAHGLNAHIFHRHRDALRLGKGGQLPQVLIGSL